MKTFINPIKHLKSVEEDYFEHAFFAIKWGLFLLITGLISVIHGFLPFLFPFVAPKNVLKLKKVMDERNEEDRIRSAESEA